MRSRLFQRLDLGQSRLRGCWFVALVLGIAAIPAAAPAAEPLDFNRDIRPILAENCFYCHGQDPNKRQADLRLDERQPALEFGAIVPNDPAASSLIERIMSSDPDLQMPPANSNRQLSPEQRETLQRWIAEGANYATHWAFVTPTRPAEPAVQNSEWVRNSIDRFILAKLEANGLSPSPEADRATLIRRLSIDLTGLPPTPEEVAAFVADPSEEAYAALVDRLLQSPHYGERMALPWLDAARYADSNGFQQDGDTWQWLWRDWVVNAMNNDMPFDQFTIEQLAGDLLPNATTDQQVASGFNRNHLLNGEGGAIAEEQRFVNLFDRVDTTSTVWLGLTMACAQCHDHKYDPLTMHDYYGMLDAFNRVPESGVPQYFSSRIRVAPPIIELPTAENQARIAAMQDEIKRAENRVGEILNAAYLGWKQGLLADGRAAEGNSLPDAVVGLLQIAEAERTEEQKSQLEAELRKHFDSAIKPTLDPQIPAVGELNALNQRLNEYRADQIPRAMVMSDAQPRQTHLLDRGQYLSPTEPVSFRTPDFLPALPADAPTNRLGLAQWLVSAEHPLTARVQVNRMWQHFFGLGIVKTSEDFGVQSEYPIHGALLDWLAVEFREQGWSSKHMHRLIVMSATYRQSSRVSAEHYELDAENRQFARGARFRMPAMLLRDWALATAGMLDSRLGGAPVYPYQPGDVWEALAITKERDFTYPASNGNDLYRRSLYTFWRRTVSPANMFDASNRQACRVRASITSTPLHALTTLNDPTWVEASRVLATRVSVEQTEIDARLATAFERVVCRAPNDHERVVLRRAFDKQLAFYSQDVAAAEELLKVGAWPQESSENVSEQAALAMVCLAILNLDEALTRE